MAISRRGKGESGEGGDHWWRVVAQGSAEEEMRLAFSQMRAGREVEGEGEEREGLDEDGDADGERWGDGEGEEVSLSVEGELSRSIIATACSLWGWR